MFDNFDDDILICIFNYKIDKNAREWRNLLSPYFETIVLDSGNDKVYSDFIQYPNIYYSGLWNEMKKFASKKKYSWIGVIPSDITMDEKNKRLLIDKISWLKTTRNVGMWQPSLDSSSRNWLNNMHRDDIVYESKKVLEGHFFFIRNSVVSEIPYIDRSINKFGYGLSEVMSFMSSKMGYVNVFDNSIVMHHPSETGYNVRSAIKESLVYTPKIAKSLGLNYNDMLVGGANSNGPCEIEYYSDEISDRIIVSMTTWEKRIGNIPKVLDSILGGTIKPYKIVVNISSEEFGNGGEKIPSDVSDYIAEHSDIIELNILKNNTLVWKKSIPTLIKYPNDCVICIDDDFIYPEDFVENFSIAHKNNPNHPISGVDIKLFDGKIQHCGCASLDKLEYLTPHIWNLSDEIYNNGDEDTFYTYCYKMNGRDMIYVGKQYWSNMPSLNAVEGYSKNHKISNKKTWDICSKNVVVGKPNKIIDRICASSDVSFVSEESVDKSVPCKLLVVIMDYGNRQWCDVISSVFDDVCDTRIVKCPDGRYSDGMTVVCDELIRGKYSHVLMIKSNVNIVGNDRNKKMLLSKIDKYMHDNTIGVYSPSHMYAGTGNKSRRMMDSIDMRDVDDVSDSIVMFNAASVRGIDKVSFGMCHSGNGFVSYLCDTAKNNGYRVVVDDSVYITSVYVRSYSNESLLAHKRIFDRLNR